MNGPGTLILLSRSVRLRRNSARRTSTGSLRRILTDDPRGFVDQSDAVNERPGAVQIYSVER